MRFVILLLGSLSLPLWASASQDDEKAIEVLGPCSGYGELNGEVGEQTLWQFSDLTLEGEVGKPLRLACSMIMTVALPEGFQVGVGQVTLKAHSLTSMKGDHLVRLSKGFPRFSAKGTHRKRTDELRKGPLVVSSPKQVVWGSCGAKTIRVQWEWIVVSREEKPLIQIDELAVAPLWYRRCSPKENKS